MKKNLLRIFTLSLISLSFLNVSSQGFVHPGGLHTQGDFDRVKQQLKDGNETIVGALEDLRNSGLSTSDFGYYTYDYIKRGTTGDNYVGAARNISAAYQNALMWKITDDTAHADKAIAILNAWAGNCFGIQGDTNASLASGLYGYQFAQAAELMRDYEGWNTTDFKKFQQWMLDVFYPFNLDFLKRRHGTCASHYWANWGLCNTLSMILIGILCDDVHIYNQGVSYYKYNLAGETYMNDDGWMQSSGYNEYINNLVYYMHEDERGTLGYFGQMQESGRDQGHALMCLGLASDICDAARSQGDDLFAYKDFRLLAGIEYTAAFNVNTSLELPYTSYIRTWSHYCSNHEYYTGISWGGSVGAFRPYWDRIIGYYEGIQGLELTYSRQMRDKSVIDSGPRSDSSGGGLDHLGYTTLTCSRPKVDRDQAPTPLKAAIVYRGVSYERGEYSGLKVGTSIKLSPSLADGTSGDNGSWQWDSGETTRELQISATESKHYRVTYTNEKGIESVQLFSIAVEGDCWPDKLTPTITVDNVTYNDTIGTILKGTGVTLEVWSQMGGNPTYSWSNGQTESSITISSIQEDRQYSVVCTSDGGNKQTINFHVKTSLLKASLSIDQLEVQKTDSILISSGQQVELRPIAAEASGTWLWNDGSTEQYLNLGTVTKTGNYSVTYTYNNEEYKLNYSILVSVPSKVITNGEYYIIDATTKKFLSNDGTTTPVFNGKYEEGRQDSLVWVFARDGERYRIMSKKDYRCLNENAVLVSINSYDSAWHSYILNGVDSRDIYAIQNGGSSGTQYWVINSNYSISGRGSDEQSGFPFEIISVASYVPENASGNNSIYKSGKNSIYPNPVSDYLIVSVEENNCTNAIFSLYSLSGQQVFTTICSGGQNRIDVNRYAKGLYIGVLEVGGVKESFKMIKE